MPKITNIESAGQPWTSQNYGVMYPFRYVFDDGRSGLQNHTTPQSPFQIGQDVDIENKGSDKQGNTKIKVSKAGSNFNAGGNQPAQPGAVSTGNDGQRCGMAINNACHLIARGIVPAGEKLSQTILQLAYSITVSAKKLEAGWSPNAPTAPVAAPQPAPVQPPVQPAPVAAPVQQPVQQFEEDIPLDAGEDCPF